MAFKFNREKKQALQVTLYDFIIREEIIYFCKHKFATMEIILSSKI